MAYNNSAQRSLTRLSRVSNTFDSESHNLLEMTDLIENAFATSSEMRMLSFVNGTNITDGQDFVKSKGSYRPFLKYSGCLVSEMATEMAGYNDVMILECQSPYFLGYPEIVYARENGSRCQVLIRQIMGINNGVRFETSAVHQMSSDLGVNSWPAAVAAYSPFEKLALDLFFD